MKTSYNLAAAGFVFLGMTAVILKMSWEPYLFAALVWAFLAMAEAMSERS